MCYVIKPPDLSYNYGGCGSALSIYHTLECKKGGLITARHNKLHDGVANLAIKCFTPTYVHYYPKHFIGHAVRVGKTKSKAKGLPPKDKGENKGDILIRDIWT